MGDQFPDTSPSSPPRRRFRYAPLISVSVAFLLVAAAALGYRAWFVSQAEKAVAELTRRLDEKDPGWRFEDILKSRKVMPSEKNPALEVSQALALLPEESRAADPEGLMEELDALGLPNLLEVERMNALKSELDALRPAIELGRRLSGTQEWGRFPVDWKLGTLSTRMPHLSRISFLSDLLSLDAAAQAQEREGDGALRSSRAILVAGRSLGDEPVIISQLMHQRQIRRGIQAMERILGLTEPSPDGLEETQRLLQFERSDLPSLFIQGLRGERGQFYDIFGAVADGKVSLAMLRNYSGADVESWLDGAKRWLYIGARVRSCQAMFAEEVTRLLEALALPLEEQAPKAREWSKQIQERDRQLGENGDYHVLATFVLTSLGKALDARYETQMGLDCAILALAAERYRLKNGKWPEKAQDLVPEFVKEIPRDIFSGEPLQMRRTVDGITFHSVGPGADGPGMEKGDIAFRLFDPGKRRSPAAPSKPAEEAEGLRKK